MKIKIFLILFITQFMYSQNLLNGRVESDLGVLDGILIVNRSLKLNTTTSNGGKFEINANPNDVLIISSSKIEPLEIRLNSNSFRQNPLVIKVKIKPNELDEVKIVELNAARLAAMGNSAKKYTPAERKLRTAEKLKWYSPLLIPFGGMSVDGLINQISGRTNRLKKELKVEKNEINYKKLKNSFSEDFYRNTLTIPEDYLDGFLVYASENPKVVQYLKDNNIGELRFSLIDLAFQYKEMISVEK